MGCNCNSNFSGGSNQESDKLIATLDKALNEGYKPLMTRYSAYLNNGIKTGVYTDKGFKITLDDNLKSLLTTYKEKFDTSIKIEDEKAKIETAKNILKSSGKFMPPDVVAKYEEKIKTANNEIAKNEKVLVELNKPVDSKFAKIFSKTNLMILGGGVALLIGYKLYKKFR